MLSRIVTLAGLLSLCAPAFGDTLDINLNNDSVRLDYTTPYRTAEFDVGGLYSTYRNIDTGMLHAGLLVLGEQNNRNGRVEAGIGGRVYAASFDQYDVIALALGGQFRWLIGGGPLGISAYGYYAPDVVTGVDGKRMWEYGADLEFEVIAKTASIYAGYRRVEVTLDIGPEVIVDRGGHVGLKLRF